MELFQMEPGCDLYKPVSIREILSPTHGTVERIENGKLHIYINVTDNHDIFSPVEGYVVEISTVDGYTHVANTSTTFKSEKNRRGRVKFTIETEIEKMQVSFQVEVGKGYVTDRINYSVTVDKFVMKGEKIGQIVLGSRSMIWIPRNARIKVSDGQKIRGGETVIALY